MKGLVVENVVLTVHLILAILLIGLVLLQRSEGGGLGIGGGGGGVMTGRQAANAMSKLTWLFAVGFLITSLSLTIIAARNASSGSIADQLDLGGAAPSQSLPGVGAYTPPPGSGQPVTPGQPAAPTAGSPIMPPAPAAPAAEAPAASAPEAPAAEVPATEPAPAATNN